MFFCFVLFCFGWLASFCSFFPSVCVLNLFLYLFFECACLPASHAFAIHSSENARSRYMAATKPRGGAGLLSKSKPGSRSFFLPEFFFLCSFLRCGGLVCVGGDGEHRFVYFLFLSLCFWQLSRRHHLHWLITSTTPRRRSKLSRRRVPWCMKAK